MKNFFLMLALSFCSFTILAQKTTVSIGLDAIGIYTGEYEETGADLGAVLHLESALNNKFTLMAEVGKFNGNLMSSGGFKFTKNTWNLKTGFNFYPKAAHQGFFLGAHLGYTDRSYKLKTASNEPPTTLWTPESYFGAGLQLGFKTNLSERLTFGTMTAVNLGFSNGGEDAGLIYNIGARVGYRF